MGPKQLSLVSSAYVTADLYEPNFFHALAQQCADKLKYSDYASFTRIVKSFAAVGHRHPKLSAQALAFADRHVKKLR